MDNALGLELCHLLGHIEGLDGCRARQHTTGAVRTGAERVGIAESFHDVGSRSLRAGDDADDSLTGEGGTLAVYDDILSEVVLPSGVVVGDVDHRFELNARQCVGKHFLDALHHQFAVAEGEVDAVLHFLPVHVELLASTGEERQADVGRHHGVPLLIECGGQLVVIVAYLFAQVA